MKFYTCMTIFPTYRCPVYEIPESSYSGEQILTILLNPNINETRVCSERPSNVLKSSTYVVDLEELKHPDDVKKDEFGSWKYSG